MAYNRLTMHAKCSFHSRISINESWTLIYSRSYLKGVRPQQKPQSKISDCWHSYCHVTQLYVTHSKNRTQQPPLKPHLLAYSAAFNHFRPVFSLAAEFKHPGWALTEMRSKFLGNYFGHESIVLVYFLGKKLNLLWCQISCCSVFYTWVTRISLSSGPLVGHMKTSTRTLRHLDSCFSFMTLMIDRLDERELAADESLWEDSLVSALVDSCRKSESVELDLGLFIRMNWSECQTLHRWTRVLSENLSWTAGG